MSVLSPPPPVVPPTTLPPEHVVPLLLTSAPHLFEPLQARPCPIHTPAVRVGQALVPAALLVAVWHRSQSLVTPVCSWEWSMPFASVVPLTVAVFTGAVP